MREEFLSYIWQYQLIESPLKLTDGTPIIVKNPGTLNSDAGPDFFDARIQIGETLWAGNVEIHVKGSDWFLHQHDKDRAYDNVILHVVYTNDKMVGNTPTLSLSGTFDESLAERYESIVQNKHWIPCEKLITHVSSLTRYSWLDALIVERLKEKTTILLELLEKEHGDWEEIFYIWLMRNFGFKTNELPFQMLSYNLSFRTLLRESGDPTAIESLILGLAGFLEEPAQEPYPQMLKTQFLHFKNKYNLTPLDPHIWKFSRLRPANFPTIRLAQFSALVNQQPKLFSSLTECNSVEQLFSLFSIQTNPYWDNHYRLNHISQLVRPKKLGETARTLLCINSVIPFLFIYGKETAQETLCEKAIHFLEEIKAENNTIIRKWSERGIKASNALESQALLQLKKHYCDKKRCLACRIGIQIMQQKG